MVLKIESLTSEEVAKLMDGVLEEKVYPLVASKGIQKKGGRRFFVNGLGTLGIEKTLASENMHYFVLSIPEETVREKIGNGETDSLQVRIDEIYRGAVVYAPRPSRDQGKTDRHFFEIRFPIDTSTLLSCENLNRAFVKYLTNGLEYPPEARLLTVEKQLSMIISK